MENIQKEKYISTSPEPLSIEGTKKILEQMQNCVCKIYNGEKGTGTGFFTKIPYKSILLFFHFLCKVKFINFTITILFFIYWVNSHTILYICEYIIIEIVFSISERRPIYEL